MEGGFDEMYRQHAPRIYSLACRIAGSPQDGEDLLQEIFLQAYRKMDTFKGDHLDVFFPTHEQAKRWGARWLVVDRVGPR